MPESVRQNYFSKVDENINNNINNSAPLTSIKSRLYVKHKNLIDTLYSNSKTIEEEGINEEDDIINQILMEEYNKIKEHEHLPSPNEFSLLSNKRNIDKENIEIKENISEYDEEDLKKAIEMSLKEQ